jgi:hypothetical protein
MMTTKNGSYQGRFYLDPQYLVDLAKLPEGFTVRTVMWQPERQSFVFVIDMPENSRYFVPQDAILPVYPAAITVIHGEDGDQLRVRFPQLEEEEGQPDGD